LLNYFLPKFQQNFKGYHMPDKDKAFSLESRVRTSQLLGKNKSLVLHGGGNTSVKISETNILGEEEEILYVKGSGQDLETVTADGFSPVRISHLKKLSELSSLSDSDMVNELVTHLTRSSAPIPSVEAILHAVIPYKYVDHTHADAIIAISNSINGENILRQLYGDQVIYIPYVMPGFDLSKLCAQQLKYELTPDKIGIILLHHGVFSFGETADESYNRMLQLVSIAEEYLKKNAVNINPASILKHDENNIEDFALLRKNISCAAGFPVIMKRVCDEKNLLFCNRSDIKIVSQQGPATPDHVIRTKRLPMLGRDINKYIEDYKKYFEENEPLAKDRKKMLDPAPRVVLDPEFGLCAIGRTSKDAAIVADIYNHTIDIIQWAQALGGYRALPAKDIFDVEYWELEQAKMNNLSKSPVFTGEIALVTGAASGIGKACVESLLKRGAAVVGLDLNNAIKNLFSNSGYVGIQCDVTVEPEVIKAIEKTVYVFGGLDMLVLNAGIFPAGQPVKSLTKSDWRSVMNINLDANLFLLSQVYPFLKLAVKGGRVAIIGSKNVSAPGPGVAAYSVSKAALNQLARVIALEWGKDAIRINTVHPNAVFDTGLWNDEILTSRATYYGLTLEEYKKNNVLQTEIKSADVAELAVELCGTLFSKTTGAQIPVDGGNERVI
jgi:rhamnose utilization protein RhaD (predicted bifunctional aldolase and dehydrogenase)/NAD(P)-dependent dehydrogenase (short-subunit alcohol dehydrogenase family)